jgi:type I restriction enzyme, S subunit
LIPTPEILDKFHVMAKLLFENIFINEKMIEDLTKTRDILLPKLMSGEIRV